MNMRIDPEIEMNLDFDVMPRAEEMQRAMDEAMADIDFDVEMPPMPPMPAFPPIALQPMLMELPPMPSIEIERVQGQSPFERQFSGISSEPPQAWAQADPADSLYRLAREALNRGEYRRAAQLFGDITQKFPNSAYAADARYWRAFALYRLGSTSDLHEALNVLQDTGSSFRQARLRRMRRCWRRASVAHWRRRETDRPGRRSTRLRRSRVPRVTAKISLCGWKR